MPSSLAWLDFSEQERRKVLDVVGLFRQSDTVDELGVGSVRDGFADLLFPGTSTLHTRARYLIFIPWIYREIEGSAAKSRDPWQHARRAEVRLIDALADSDDPEGTIGIDARATLKNFPSTLYWAALGTWRIRVLPQSQGRYHRWLRTGGHRLASLASDEEGSAGSGAWHPQVLDPPPEFPHEASFRFKPHESAYVGERIAMAVPDSLLALLLDRRVAVGDIERPGVIGSEVELPRHLAEQLEHASCFSLAIQGAPLLYNRMLAELAQREDRIEDFERRLGGWAEEMAERRREIERWDRKAGLWEVVMQAGARIPRPTQLFVSRWLDLAIDGDPEAIAGDRRARELIRERERVVKRARARLHNPQALALWGGDAGTARLNYRWPYVQQMVGDILEGLEDGGARA